MEARWKGRGGGEVVEGRGVGKYLDKWEPVEDCRGWNRKKENFEPLIF